MFIVHEHEIITSVEKQIDRRINAYGGNTTHGDALFEADVPGGHANVKSFRYDSGIRAQDFIEITYLIEYDGSVVFAPVTVVLLPELVSSGFGLLRLRGRCKNGGVLSGRSGQLCGFRDTEDLCSDVIRHIRVVEVDAAVIVDNRDSSIVAIYSFQTVPDRQAVAHSAVAQVIFLFSRFFRCRLRHFFLLRHLRFLCLLLPLCLLRFFFDLPKILCVQRVFPDHALEVLAGELFVKQREFGVADLHNFVTQRQDIIFLRTDIDGIAQGNYQFHLRGWGRIQFFLGGLQAHSERS